MSIIGLLSAYQTKADTRMYIAEFFLAVVGIGSSAFHGTLTYNMQLLDELVTNFLLCLFFLLFLTNPK